jgi:hypothetical protein
MKDRTPEPTRLRDQLDQPDPFARLAGQAVRDSAEPEPLSAVAMARAAARIDARRGREHRLTPLGWALAIGAFVLGIVTAASAAHLDLLPSWLTRIVPDISKHSSSRAAPAGRRATAARQAWPVPSATVEEPPAPPGEQPVAEPASAPEAEAPIARVPGREPAKQADKPMPSPRGSEGGPRRPALLAGEPAAPPVVPRTAPSLAGPAEVAPGLAAERPPSAAPSSRPAIEGNAPSPSYPAPGAAFTAPPPSSAPQAAPTSPATPAPTAAGQAAPSSPPQTAGVLKEIVRALRVEHAPNRALALLDQHRNTLAGQAFAEESLLLRVEAMLALGERGKVLRLLDRTSLTDLAVSSTLLITRGELRAAANRCAEGIGDFDLVLAKSERPPKQALLGRARCRQQLGDSAGAQADFARYRREFPDDPPR